MMTEMMVAMADRSRTVDGKPTSLLDLGYKHVGLDGGWNQCFADNHTFHWASDGRPVWNSGFPDPAAMVDKAHKLGLLPGWYLMIERGSAQAFFFFLFSFRARLSDFHNSDTQFQSPFRLCSVSGGISPASSHRLKSSI